MTLDQVMRNVDSFREHAPSQAVYLARRQALIGSILSYGRAQRERAAKVCDERVFAMDYTGNQYRRPAPADECAAAIRSLPDEEQAIQTQVHFAAASKQHCGGAT